MRPATYPFHPKLPWLKFCVGCNRYHDSELFIREEDEVCATQVRRAERIKEGLIDYSDVQGSGTKAGIRRRIKSLKDAEAELVKYKARRKQELLEEGVMPHEVWAILQGDLAAKRQALGLL